MPLTTNLADLYRGKSVFITGHTGFKAGWLTAWLHRMGAKIHGFALAAPTSPSLFESARLEPLLASHTIADISDMPALQRALDAARPDVVFHMAAQAIVRDSYLNPRDTFQVNAMGTVNVLEAIRQAARPTACVVVTSDKCYDNREHPWGYRECDAMGGHDPYSASKGVAEIITASYRQSYFPAQKISSHGVRIATARAGNVIGGGDWANARILVDAAKALSANQPILVRNPHAIRPWQHVLDPLSGYLTLGAKMLQEPQSASWSQAWNFGPLPGQDIPVSQIVELFIQAWGSGSWKDASDPSQPHEARVLRLSIDKALSDLGWRPRFDVRQAVSLTAAWYRRFYQNPAASSRDALYADIDTFTAP